MPLPGGLPTLDAAALVALDQHAEKSLAWLHEARGKGGEWTDGGDLGKLGHKLLQDAASHPEEERTATGSQEVEGSRNKARVTAHKDGTFDVKVPGETHKGITSDKANSVLAASEDVNGKYKPDAA